MTGIELLKLRRRAQMPAAVLARTIGVNPSVVCAWEKGYKPVPVARHESIREAIAAYTPPGPEVWFWPKVDVRGPDECWPWTRHTLRRGYGGLRRDKKGLTASRVAWELTHGPITNGLWVLHHCDNPPCCNPAHLFLGTQKDNMDDMHAKGRGGQGRAALKKRGSLAYNAKLNEEIVREIRILYATGTVRQIDISRRLGVSSGLVSMIVNGHIWKHVEVPEPEQRTTLF